MALAGSFSLWTLVSLAVCLTTRHQPAGAYDPLDPYGNIAIKWDILLWTNDGYKATVSLYNSQQYRGIESYHLGWHWDKDEVIYNIVGARATEQGDCTGIPAPPPHSCLPNPTIIDLPRGVPYKMQVANCCRDGFIAAHGQDRDKSLSSFSITVGRSGNTNTSVKIPHRLSLRTPHPGYTCGNLTKVAATRFPSADGKRYTQAYLTWHATCVYSQFLAQKAPTCCVSLSAFYSPNIVKCPDCACSCRPSMADSGINILPGIGQPCVSTSIKYKDIPTLQPGRTSFQSDKNDGPLSLFCTNDMCPVKIHWHLKANYKTHWKSKIAITNRHFGKNYSDWNIVVQHQNFGNFTGAFNFTSLTLDGDGASDAAMFWGMNNHNDMLLQAGPEGNVQSDLLFVKDARFTLSKGWGFPSRVYFNGDSCVLPDPQHYPSLPSRGARRFRQTFFVLALLASSGLSLLRW